MKKILLLLSILILMAGLSACGIESVDEHESKIQKEKESVQAMQEKPDDKGNISIKLTVRADKVISHPALKTEAKIPEDGFWVDGETIVVNEDITVYDLMVAARFLDLFEFKDRNSSSMPGYIGNINNLAEKECGSESGWKFQVNGEISSKGSSQVKVKDGDEVTWYYAVNIYDGAE